MRTVNKILCNFEKQVEQLYAIRNTRDNAITARNIKISALNEENAADTEESIHATRVARKIKEIIQ